MSARKYMHLVWIKAGSVPAVGDQVKTICGRTVKRRAYDSGLPWCQLCEMGAGAMKTGETRLYSFVWNKSGDRGAVSLIAVSVSLLAGIALVPEWWQRIFLGALFAFGIGCWLMIRSAQHGVSVRDRLDAEAPKFDGDWDDMPLLDRIAADQGPKLVADVTTWLWLVSQPADPLVRPEEES